MCRVTARTRIRLRFFRATTWRSYACRHWAPNVARGSASDGSATCQCRVTAHPGFGCRCTRATACRQLAHRRSCLVRVHFE